MNYKIILTIGCWLFFLTACSISSLERARVNIEFKNQSANDMSNVIVRFGKYECSVGVLMRASTAGYGDFTHPITDEAEVHWDANGIHKVEKVSLLKVFEKRKSGTLEFVVTDKGVSVRFIEDPASK